jgi:transcriptional regulator with XRE-family HTH domain
MRLADGHPGTFNPHRLWIARAVRMLKAVDVARVLGVQVPCYRRWERGDVTPSPQEVGRLSFALGFPLGFFYGADAGSEELESVHICGLGC